MKTKIAIEKTILSTNCETHQRYNISQNNVILFTISCSPWPKYWADDGARWKSLMGTWICVQNGMDRSSNTCQDISLKTTNVSLMVVFGESVRYSIKTIDICTKCQRNSSKSCWDASVVDPQTNTVIACLSIIKNELLSATFTEVLDVKLLWCRKTAPVSVTLSLNALMCN